MVMPTRRPLESFSLPGQKLKPQQGTMLLLPVEKIVSRDLLLFLCLSFLREQATRQGANQLKTRSLPTLMTHVLPPIFDVSILLIYVADPFRSISRAERIQVFFSYIV